MFRLQGALVSRESWFNLGKQQLQPLFQKLVQLKVHVSISASNKVALQLSWVEAAVEYGHAYDGGSILVVQGVPSAALNILNADSDKQ